MRRRPLKIPENTFYIANKTKIKKQKLLNKNIILEIQLFKAFEVRVLLSFLKLDHNVKFNEKISNFD
jgi:hypothetical protein